MYFLFAFNLRLTTCIQIDKKKAFVESDEYASDEYSDKYALPRLVLY